MHDSKDLGRDGGGFGLLVSGGVRFKGGDEEEGSLVLQLPRCHREA